MNEKQKAKVSVIIPCYCCMKTITRAVDSVARQTMLPSEVILIEDDSNDDTLVTLNKIKESYPNGWVKVVSLSSNSGPGSARNKGWEIANQPYIAFLDADDSWHPQKIEAQYLWMAKNSDVVMTGHDCKVILNEVQIDNVEKVNVLTPISVKANKLLFSNQFSTPTIMLKRDIQQRFVERKRYAEDYLLWLQIKLSGQKIYKFKNELSYLYKEKFGESGLSAQLWNMQKGELDTYFRLYKENSLPIYHFLMLGFYSNLKFLRRLLHSFLK